MHVTCNFITKKGNLAERLQNIVWDAQKPTCVKEKWNQTLIFRE